MPFKSRAQSRLFHDVEHNPELAAKTGLSQSAAKKFIADSAGQKVSKLPEHVSKKAHGGRAFTQKPKPVGW